MPVIAVGLNHRSAPLSLLERVAVQPENFGKALASLVLRDNLSEVVIVSTCMRTEVYAVAERFHGAVSDIFDFLGHTADMDADDISEHAYSFHDAACVTHLFRVAAGLDSAVLGEGEVLGQIRDAWERGMVERTSGPVLNALFRHAAEVGKRSRAETAIARGITSIPQAGVALASGAMGECLDSASVLVVGAGTIGAVVASAVAESWQPHRIVISSRAVESAEGLCQRLSDAGYAESVPANLDDMDRMLAEADVVFSATASSEALILLADVEAASTLRPGRRLIMVDLAVPRDVDPAVADLPDVTLFDMDSIRAFVEAETLGKVAEVARVAEIVEEEVARYLETVSARQVAPLVATLHNQAESIRNAELERYRRRLVTLDDSQRSAVEALTKAIIAKVLHVPTVRLKSSAGTPRGERLGESLRDLFDL